MTRDQDAPPSDADPTRVAVLDRAPQRPSVRPSRGGGLLRGRPGDPRWARSGLVALLVVTAALYLWDLGASGWANSFYSAAVQAGSVSWKALFFGASDAGASITVDKPPASLWVMALSVRVFGLSSWSILVPQALMGVATTWLLHSAVARRFGAGTALLAGALFALTPVAALMFRFNNPDALLVLLMTGAAYSVLRATEAGSRATRWLLLAGALVGVGFLTKQLQVFLVVPALALTYLVAGPARLRRRVVDLLAAGAAIVVAAGWWVAAVQLWPASSRPYIGGSSDNSFLGLTFGYNGLGRLTGQQTATGRASQRGGVGLTRMLHASIAGQVTWVLPAAVLLGAVALVLLRRLPRTDGRRAHVVMWGTWLAATGLVLSLMSGIFHAYYTVALAPAVAGLTATAASVVWGARRTWVRTTALAAATAGTAAWSFVLLSRSPAFLPGLSWAVLVAGLLAAVGVLALPLRPSLTTAVAGAALAACLAGPTAYTLDTVLTPHTGSLVSAGPAVAGAAGPGGPGGRHGGMRGATPGEVRDEVGAGAPAGSAGAPETTPVPSAAMRALLEQDAARYTWVAATVDSDSAAGYQLATQDAVVPIGGFTGNDPSPTLARFQQWVAQRRVHYFIARALEGGRGAPGTSAAAITAWVQGRFTAQTVGGTTVYDLTTGATGA